MYDGGHGISRGFLFRSLLVCIRTQNDVDENKKYVDEFHNLGFRRVFLKLRRVNRKRSRGFYRLCYFSVLYVEKNPY